MKIIYTLFFVLSLFTSFAGNYSLDNSVSPFSPISKGTVYNFEEGEKINIGFHFKVFDQYFGQIESIDSKGRIYFHNQGDKKLNFISAAGYTKAKYVNSNDARILYSVSGKEGNRILKVEWKNMNYQLENGKTFSVNYQVLLYEMGFFEVHYGECSEGYIQTPTYLGLGKSNLKHKGHKYELTIEQGPFAPMLNVETTALKLIPARETVFVFKLDENYDINTLITYKKYEDANIELFIEMENAKSIYLSIDDEHGETVYTEEISEPTLLIERNLDIDIDHSKKCYLNIETTEKVFITPITLQSAAK